MPSTSRRVVLTGIGVVTPIGTKPGLFWEGLSRGQNGIRILGAFDSSTLPSRMVGEIADFDAKNYIDKKDRKSLRVMARGIQLAVAGAQLALDDSGVDKEKLDPTRFGVEFGAGLLPTELQELGPACQVSVNGHPDTVDLKIWGEQGIPCIPPLWMLKYLPNMLACHVSILHNAQGPNNTITESDVASLLALGEAFRIIRRNQADFFLTGGADSKINPLSMVRQCLFSILSRRNDAPDKACRPFDLNRDGMVIGEGAGILVLEELEHARRRGARIYAEVIGFASAFDRDRSGKGLVRAIRQAMNQAGIGPNDVDHVNAHGLSTIKSDRWEARALKEIFSPASRPIPVVAIKSYFGNLCAGSGTTELIASILALVHGQIPATRNFEVPDPECTIPVTRTPQPVTREHVLKIGFTDLGQCAAVVCRKWEE